MLTVALTVSSLVALLEMSLVEMMADRMVPLTAALKVEQLVVMMAALKVLT